MVHRMQGDGRGTFGTELTHLSPTTSPTSRLVDQYGRTLTATDASAYGPPTDKLGDSSTAGVVKRDIPINLITRWREDSIQSAIDLHMLGDFRMSSFLCDSMMGDDRVSSTIGQRMGALFSRPMKTTPCINGVESDDDEAVAVADAWNAAWDRFAPLEVLEEIHAWGTTSAVVPVELQWDRSVTPWQPILKPWHPTHLLYRWDLHKYTITTMDGVEVIEPGDGRWMLYTPHGPHRGWRRGAVRPMSVPWFFRQLTWRDWARYNERHGLAIIKAKAPARTDAKIRDRWVQGLSHLGQEAVILCPQNIDGTGYDAEIMEAKDRSFESFDRSMGRADMAIVLSILWQNLTTEVQGGSYAAATVHEGVQQTAARYDNGTLSSFLYTQGARAFAGWNYGRPELAPKRSWVIAEPSDHLASAQAFGAFAKAISDLRTGGVKLSIAGIVLLAHRFNLPLTEDQISSVAVDVAGGGDPPKGKT